MCFIKIFLASFVVVLHLDPIDSIFFTCPKSYGYFRDPHVCSVFYRCVNWRPFSFSCQKGQVFDENHDVCTWPSDAWPECGHDKKNDYDWTTVKSNNNELPPTEAVPLGNEPTLWLPEVNTEEQCNFIELTLNVILQALVRVSSENKCADGDCNLQKISVRCTQTTRL